MLLKVLNVLNKTATCTSLHLSNLILIHLGRVSNTEPHGEFAVSINFLASNNHRKWVGRHYESDLTDDRQAGVVFP